MSTEHESPVIPQEEDRPSSSGIWWTFGVTIAVTVLATYWAYWLMVREVGALGRADILQETTEPPRAPAEIGIIEQTPIEKAFPGARRVRAQRELLERWTWVDRPRHLVRMPIRRAMELEVQEGGK